jgi:hypothetical protein
MVLQDWLVEPMMGKEDKVLVTFPGVSCPSLGENSGVIKAIRVPLVHGSTIIINHHGQALQDQVLCLLQRQYMVECGVDLEDGGYYQDGG